MLEVLEGLRTFPPLELSIAVGAIVCVVWLCWGWFTRSADFSLEEWEEHPRLNGISRACAIISAVLLGIIIGMHLYAYLIGGDLLCILVGDALLVVFVYVWKNVPRTVKDMYRLEGNN